MPGRLAGGVAGCREDRVLKGGTLEEEGREGGSVWESVEGLGRGVAGHLSPLGVLGGRYHMG